MAQVTGVRRRTANAERPPRWRREAIVCTFAAAWMILGGRWASYVGFPPLFLTDVLIAVGIVHWVSTRANRRDDPPIRPDAQPVHVLLVLFLLWSVVRFALSARLDLVALRDAVPYLYAGVGVIAAISLRRATDLSRRRTANVLIWALGIHMAWNFLSLVAWPDLPNHTPVLNSLQQVSIFKVRTDYDSPINGVFAAWISLRFVSGRGNHRVWSFLAVAAAWVTVFSATSRAGLLGSLIAAGFALLAALRSPEVTARRQISLVLVIPVALIALIGVLPQTTVGQRLSGTFGTGTESAAAAGAAGTTQARSRTWKLLWDYSQESSARFLIGVGHGPNFMAESGAGLLLVGTVENEAINPRAPHNYVLNTLLREGLIGAGLFLLLALTLFRHAWMSMRRWPNDDLLALSALVPIALFIPACLGVVMESPFGAIPFFWCAGVFLALTGPKRPEVDHSAFPTRARGSVHR